MSTKKNGSYQVEDILRFPENIDLIPFEDKFIVLSVNTGNWIVLYNDIQKKYFQKLSLGMMVGEVYELAEQETHLPDLMKVLTFIYAREFALVGQVPQVKAIDASKFLNIYLTNACNLHCIHCFMNAGVKLGNELCLDKWQEVLRDFCNLGGEFVTFTGGEPTMYSHFEEIVTYAHQIGLKVTVLSNGLLWNEDKIQRMKPCIDEIQFSLDGVTEQDNAKVRGKNHFRKVVDTVCAFAKADVKTSVATTFTWENLSTAEMYKCFVDSIRSKVGDKVFFKLTKKMLPGRGKFFSDEENKRYYEQIDAIERYVDPTASYANFIEGHVANVITRNCGFGGLSIASNGNVYFCNRIQEVDCYGNVNHESLEELLAEGHRVLDATAVENISNCKDCKLRYVCGGDCRIDHFNFKGRVRGWKFGYIQTKCTENFKQRLMKKMVDSFSFYYC